MHAQMLDSLANVGRGRDRAGWDPPEREMGLGQSREPLASPPHHLEMMAVVDEAPERLHRLPDRHVDEDSLVLERPDGGRIPLVGLEPPDETRAAVGQRVDGFQECNEISQRGRVDRLLGDRDIGLGYVPVRSDWRRIWGGLLGQLFDEVHELLRVAKRRAVAEADQLGL
jgi:hypothetical protein